MSERDARARGFVLLCWLIGHRRFQKIDLNGQQMIVKAAGGCLRCGYGF